MSNSGTEQQEEKQISGEQWLRDAPVSLKQIRRGLNLLIYGGVLVFLAAVGVLYFLFGTEMQTLFMNVLPVMSFSGNLIVFIGTILCLSIPEQAETRRLLIGAAVGFFAKLIFSGTIFLGTEVLNLPVALFLKLSGNIGLILLALALRKLLLYLNRSDQMLKVYGLLASTVLFLMGSWCLEVVADLGLVEIRLITIYSVMLVGFFLNPWFLFGLRKVLR
ncbi:MAG: hypothetical protein KDA70_11065 [Planctomycetaceae bacterium]|nr:hypothetical protein [Planctomycetaceae bacterium]